MGDQFQQEDCISWSCWPFCKQIRRWWIPDRQGAQVRYEYPSTCSSQDGCTWHVYQNRDSGNDRPQSYRLLRQSSLPLPKQASWGCHWRHNRDRPPSELGCFSSAAPHHRLENRRRHHEEQASRFLEVLSDTSSTRVFMVIRVISQCIAEEYEVVKSFATHANPHP